MPGSVPAERDSLRILVTDGDERSTLAVVRSLGKAGHHVLVTSPTGRSLAGASRHAARDEAVPDGMKHPGDFVSGIHALRQSFRPHFVLPMTELTTRLLLPGEQAGLPGQLLAASAESFEAVSDKARVLSAALERGIPDPTLIRLDSPVEIASVSGVALEFPVVIKPARSIFSSNGTPTAGAIDYAGSLETLTAKLEALDPEAYPVMIQRRLTGSGCGVFLLRWDGRIVAQFAHKRLREKPPWGGVSVYRESVELDEDLLSVSIELLEHFDWRGPAMIEFKRDAEGNAFPMEINGRFWGSLQLAVDAGVDFPRLLVALARGEQMETVERFKVGCRSRWWLGDLDQLLIRLRGRRGSTLHPLPTRLRALGSFLVLWRPGDRSEVLRPSDIRPFFRELSDWLRQLARRSE